MESPLDNVNCRMRLKRADQDDLIVDFMPDDESILGFSNRWYSDALRTAGNRMLRSGTVIRVVTPVYFVATKLEAYDGRGNNDPLASRDMEDLLSVVDGRESLAQEITDSELALRSYIAGQFSRMQQHTDFEYAIQAAACNNRDREEIIFQRWEIIRLLAST